MYQKYQRLDGTSVGGLVIPEFYNFKNSLDPAIATNAVREKSINSVFASANFGYKNFAFMMLQCVMTGHQPYLKVITLISIHQLLVVWCSQN
jgi:hypothetical protein